MTDRCSRCRKAITRGKMVQDNWRRYQPYCSYHCQEWARLDAAFAYLNKRKQELKQS